MSVFKLSVLKIIIFFSNYCFSVCGLVVAFCDPFGGGGGGRNLNSFKGLLYYITNNVPLKTINATN